MIQIKPVLDSRNKFTEIKKRVTKEQVPVYLTKNRYGFIVVLSLERCAKLTDSMELSWRNQIDKQHF